MIVDSTIHSHVFCIERSVHGSTGGTRVSHRVHGVRRVELVSRGTVWPLRCEMWPWELPVMWH